MQKIEIKKMESINGGMKCGWVGALAIITLFNPLLNDEIVRCWNN